MTKTVSIRLHEDDLALLAELKPPGTSDSSFFRGLLRSRSPNTEAPTYSEAVLLLAESARAGKVQAQVALERALRADGGAPADNDWLEKLVSGR